MRGACAELPVCCHENDKRKAAPRPRHHLLKASQRHNLKHLPPRAPSCTPKPNRPRQVEVAPIAVPPSMPLHMLLALMNEQGLDYVPVIRRHGPLEGLVTRWGEGWRG